MSTGGDPSATTFGTQVPAVPSCNQPHSVKYKHGWPGLFTGENQSKAMQRALSDLNSRGLKVTRQLLTSGHSGRDWDSPTCSHHIWVRRARTERSAHSGADEVGAAAPIRRVGRCTRRLVRKPCEASRRWAPSIGRRRLRPSEASTRPEKYSGRHDETAFPSSLPNLRAKR